MASYNAGRLLNACAEIIYGNNVGLYQPVAHSPAGYELYRLVEWQALCITFTRIMSHNAGSDAL
jgi:hypothetical protein